MNKTIEAEFFPEPIETIGDKPCILIADDNSDFTNSAKAAVDKTGSKIASDKNDPKGSSGRAEP